MCTDELLRQITLRLPERGLLLLRVRDQLRLTLAAYRTLYATSCDFGNRKLCAATEGTDTLQAQLKGLEGDIERLVAQRTELERVCEVSNVLCWLLVWFSSWQACSVHTLHPLPQHRPLVQTQQPRPHAEPSSGHTRWTGCGLQTSN